MTAKEREEIMIENFVGLQKAMTNLSVKFESLTEQINNLLEIYEKAAKNFYNAKKEGDVDSKTFSGRAQARNDNEIRDKINDLMEQNKTLAKGMVLMQEKMGMKEHESEEDKGKHKKPKPLPSS